MSNETVAPDTDDLDAFSDLLNGKVPETVLPKPDEVQEEVEEVESVEDDTDDEANPLADEDEDGEEEVEKPAPKPKTRLQERIDTLVEKARLAEERERSAIKRIEELEARKPEPEAKPVRETVDPDTPQPDDKLDNGDDKYPLGEFDPTYIRDLTRFSLRKEADAMKEQDRQEKEAREAEASREALAKEWDVKLERARETYEDLDEKNAVLEQTFRGLEPRYGEFLVTTIMSLDYGPEVLRHLADNVKEAQKIVSSGPTVAAISLGRLDARFALHDEEKSQKKLKVSQAPKPPERVNKGTSVSKTVSADTDDLTAFEQAFFVRKR